MSPILSGAGFKTHLEIQDSPDDAKHQVFFHKMALQLISTILVSRFCNIRVMVCHSRFAPVVPTLKLQCAGGGKKLIFEGFLIINKLVCQNL